MADTEHAAPTAPAPSAALPDRLTLPLEVRVHGRGGQGGVTCAKLIAALYTEMGLHVQTFGDYGSERSGAPVQAYTRVDRQAIANRNKVYQPDQLIVLDEGLMGAPVLAGVSPGAILLLNSAAAADSFAGLYPAFRFGVVDATAIAREHGIGSSSVVIINTTILGAYARLVGVSLPVLERAYASLGLAGDFAAAHHAYDQVWIREAEPDLGEARPATAASPAVPPVPPLSAHNVDIPAVLKTGTWSNQAPRYRDAPAPCNLACPAGNDVVGFIQALKRSGPEAAAAILLRTQALPSVCGRVCPAPCMQGCNRDAFDGPVNIRSLERWIADHSLLRLPRREAEQPRRLAVVGGGPAGLSAAYQLALRGHAVRLFEAGPALGGVLVNGIPAFRLPLDVLERDIERILALGVEVECNRRLGAEDLLRLQHEFDAILLCVGFGAAWGLDADGADRQGVEQGLDFLDRAKRGAARLSGHVVVVGGGNTAIDCARSALRCGAGSVTLVYRRGRAEMPAIAEEIDDAEQEGVAFLFHRQPVGFGGEPAVAAVTLAEVELGPPDASGRQRPIVTDHSSTIACDRVLLALGQQTRVDLLPPDWQIEAGRVWQDGRPLPVWLAGDCDTADGTVTHAIGNGRRAALTALARLDGETEPASLASTASTDPAVAPAQIRYSHFVPAPPQPDRHLPPVTRRHSFDESNLGLGGPEEADRCFSCGHCTLCDTCLVYCPDGVIFRSADGYRIDPDYCKGCGMCVAECPRSAMEMADKLPPSRREVTA
jgi:2-oxoacid:acceptor oxidoreductase gamma subunit (pyruvate/2-ketoisovalerate family)